MTQVHITLNQEDIQKLIEESVEDDLTNDSIRMYRKSKIKMYKNAKITSELLGPYKLAKSA